MTNEDPRGTAESATRAPFASPTDFDDAGGAPSTRRAAYVARVLTDGERAVIADPQDAVILARIKRMPQRRLDRLDAMEPAGREDRRLFGWLQLLWLRDEAYLLGTRLGRSPTHRELFADFTRHQNGLRFRAYFALKFPRRVRHCAARAPLTDHRSSGGDAAPGRRRRATTTGSGGPS